MYKLDHATNFLVRLFFVFSLCCSFFISSAYSQGLTEESWLKELKKQDPSTKIEALYALGSYKNPKLLPVFIQIIEDKTYLDTLSQRNRAKVLTSGIRAVGKIDDPKAFDVITPFLPHASPLVRSTAWKEVARYKNDSIYPLMIDALNDPDEDVRASVIESLGEIKRKESLEPLLSIMMNKKEGSSIRTGVRKAIGSHSEKDLYPVLKKWLLDQDLNKRSAAISTLTEMSIFRDRKLPMSTAVPLFAIAIKDEDVSIRSSAAHGLGNTASKEAVPLLAVALRETEESVCFGASTSLASLRQFDTHQYLVDALKDKSSSVRQCAASGLELLRDTRTAKALEYALANDSEPRVRFWSAKALGRIGQPRSIDALVNALNDGDKGVRSQVVKALGKFDDPRAVAALTEKSHGLPTTEPSVSITIDKAEQGAKKISDLIDVGNIEPAKKLLDQYLSQSPSAIPLRYQLARYHLRLSAILADNFMGFSYTRGEPLTKTVNSLKKIIVEVPSFGDAYSLLVHIYAINNDLKQANDYLIQAKKLNQAILWLSYNEAIIYLQQGNYAKANELLFPLRKQRPPNSDASRIKRYRSAWRLSKLMGMINPQYDPNEAVRSGNVKRVMINNIVEFVANNTDETPVLIQLTSNDKHCRYCTKNQVSIYKIASTKKTELTFFNASIEPWQNISRYRDLYKKYYIRGVPVNLIFYKGNLISRYDGSITSEKVAINFIDDALVEIKKNNINRHVGVNDRHEATLLSYNNKQLMAKYYAHYGFKAFAITTSEGLKWAYGHASNEASQAIASKEALIKCESVRKKRNIKQACKILVEGDNIVSNDFSRTTIAVLQNDFKQFKINRDKQRQAARKKRDQKISNFFTKYKKTHLHYKAISLAVNDEGGWSVGSASGYSSQEKANKASQKKCGIRKKTSKINAPCRLYAVSNEYVYGKSAEEILNISNSLPQQSTPLDKGVKTYQGLKTLKALAYIESDDGKQLLGWSYGYNNQQGANQRALAECNKLIKKHLSINPCKLYAVGDQFVEN